VDIVLANFTVTEERKQKVDFANPYMKVALGVVSPTGAPITKVEQLKGKKIPWDNQKGIGFFNEVNSVYIGNLLVSTI
jgi:hypothetical protein